MAKFIDLTGQRFGRLTVLERAENDWQGNARWLCSCDCGNRAITRGASLRSGETQSCGCLADEIMKLMQTHGQSNSRLYRIWTGMKERCNNPNSTVYHHYGGRGISVCDEWQKSYIAFRDWAISAGYNRNRSIDRIDVNGNYEPQNCRWATKSQQQRNKRDTQRFRYKRKMLSMADLSELSGINIRTLRSRINILGWSVEKAINTPVRKSTHSE